MPNLESKIKYAPVHLAGGGHMKLRESASLLAATYLKAGVPPSDVEQLKQRYIGHGHGLESGVIWTAEALTDRRPDTAIPGIKIVTNEI